MTPKLDEQILTTLYQYYEKNRGNPSLTLDILMQETGAEWGDILDCLHTLAEKGWLERELTDSGDVGLITLISRGRQVAAQLVAGQPLPRPKANVPVDYPPRATHFTGREQALKDLINRLQPGETITLCGPGGVGKTALAAEAIYHLAPDGTPPERFPDGIFYHNFYNIPQASDALHALVKAFGGDPRHPDLEALARHHLQHKQALLILDGTEQVDNLDPLLNLSPTCSILITSRNRDDAPTDFELIAPLVIDEAVALLEKWAKNRLTRPETTAHLCHQIGRLPLAIRLVGRYLSRRGQTDAEYLDWLQSTPFQALEQGQHQQQSIPLLLERSLAQVSQAAQESLAIIGHLALAPFDAAPIAAALEQDLPTTRHHLGELISYGLLIRPTEYYQVSHALIHSFASRRLNTSPENLHRLAAYYNTLAETESKKGLSGYQRLNPDRPHLLAVVEGCVAAEAWEWVTELVWAMQEYLDLQGHWSARLQFLSHGLSAAHHLKNRYNERACLDGLGTTYRNLGQMNKGISYHKAALKLAEEDDDKKNQGIYLGNLGNVYYRLGQVEEAIGYYKQALAIAQTIGYQRGEGIHLGNLGNAYLDLGQVEEAIGYYEQALAIAQTISDQQGEGYQLGNLGNAYYRLGQVEKAIGYYEQSLAITRKIGDRMSEALANHNLGNLYKEQGNIPLARQHLTAAVRLFEAIKSPYVEGSKRLLAEIVDS